LAQEHRAVAGRAEAGRGHRPRLQWRIRQLKVSRARIVIRGAVQGVGFRPFVYRLATELGLAGWVSNSSQGVLIEVEGDEGQLDSFLLRIESDKPPRAFIYSLEFSILDVVGFSGFEIRESQAASRPATLVLPDIATCSDCLREIFDPGNRRYLYPFTNCTNCGPRFTIIESLPYDRPNTSMKIFQMCKLCQAECANPEDRRFHAQPNACPECGPRLELWDPSGRVLASSHDALLQAAVQVRLGGILALKGLGGFQLLVDARNRNAVLRIRARKHREEKPFALMYPSLDSIRESCEVSELERRLLLSPECPIVLLHRRKTEGDHQQDRIAPAVAPGNPYLGVMLPYTPLHHILMQELAFPLVATSGNLSDEPICIEEQEALRRLGDIADVFLVHNRPILRHVDDSVVRLIMGREQILRRARGYAPLPVLLECKTGSVLAVGAHLKNAVAITVPAPAGPPHDEPEEATDGTGEGAFSLPGQVIVSQHIGDLETQGAFEAFLRVIADLGRLYDASPQRIVCDLHPDYLSSQYAKEFALARGLSLSPIQHHYAHVTGCMAENQVEAPALGIAWDGTGLGMDGTIWGGEFLLVNETGFERAAHFRQFKLLGGEAAIKEPRRAALGVLYELFGDRLFEHSELAPVRQFVRGDLLVLQQMLEKGINSPQTSSVGRLFDVVASILGLRHQVAFEGQAAMELEFAVVEDGGRYGYAIRKEKDTLIIDWEPAIREMLADVERKVPVGKIAARFHNMLVEAAVEIAYRIEEERIVLTGGCFQNRYLAERAVRRFEAEGFRPYWHQRVPPNDGGIALGQVFAVVRKDVFSRPRTARGAALPTRVEEFVV
jgi:hydrogenase maturation protein HypF